MAELFGVAAGVVGFLSLGLQLGDSIVKLQEIRHTYKDAQADVEALITTLEGLASIMKKSGKATQPETDAISKQKEKCQDIIDCIDRDSRLFLKEIQEKPRAGRWKAIFRKKPTEGWLAKLKSAKDDLVLALLLSGRDDNAARFDDLSTSIKRMEQLLQDSVDTLPTALQRRRRLFAASPIPTVFSLEDDGVWTLADLNGDGFQDLVHIKTKNTGSGKIEVHGASNESLFSKEISPITTAFSIEDQDGTWVMQDWTGDGKADLIYIKTRNTGTNSVEIHVATAESGYQRFARQVGTCFGCEDDGVWDVSSKGDLVYIKTRNCGSSKIEYHIASKASNYRQFTQHVATAFDLEDNGTWCLAPTCSGFDFADLYYIKSRNTRSRKIEVQAASAGSGWKSRLVDITTSFEPEDSGRWLMVDLSLQGRPDLVYIKTSGCESGKVEVHVVGSK